MKKVDGLDFLRERTKQIKKEIRERKSFKKDIMHELMLNRTWKFGRQNELQEMWEINDIIVKHYEAILIEHENMINEIIDRKREMKNEKGRK